ncbi:sensor histidine kinase [Sinomicrobium soli]|uniref:sensor histidine kinase n=1 Tax=Sinomicrobium sp. N-1-3-6 TaxID=2219864 RepID=UPI000DCCF89E|nr:ATP-binding protein [Sinomicrobium sp. N-1-3-6]RAV30848.1 hypothetical protein DN748_00895 [Sinomicrobium sp. N-1-3-6]
MRLTLIILYSLFCHVSYCKQINNSFTHDHNLRWYTDSDGLPQNTITEIFKDIHGYIWLLTKNGVVRYNGSSFRTYNSENTGLGNNSMTQVTGNRKSDSIWVFNDFDEALLITRRTARHVYYNKPGIPSGTPFFAPGSTVALDQVPESGKSDFFKVGDTLCHISKSGKYTLIYGENYTSGMLDLKNDSIGKIIYNRIAQQVFILTSGNLYTVTKEKDRLLVSPLLNRFSYHRFKDIISIYYDRSLNELYLGSNTRGLGVIRPKKFHSHYDTNPDRVQYALIAQDSNTVLTANGTRITADSSGIRTSRIRFPCEGDETSMTIDTFGNIWTKKQDMLYCFRKDTGFNGYRQWKLPGDIGRVYLGKNGNIWITTRPAARQNTRNKGALYRMNPAQPDQPPLYFRSVGFDISYILQTPDSSLWLGSYKGLYRLDLKTSGISTIPGLQDKHIKNLYAGTQNELWIATATKGIFLYRNDTLTGFPPDRYGYMRSPLCIREDAKGFLWVSSGKGLFQVSKQKMIDYATGKTDQVYYHYYDKSSGFTSNEFNGDCQPCGETLSNGYIAFPSLEGIVLFDPLQIHPRLPNTKLYLDEVYTVQHREKVTVHNDTIHVPRDFSRIYLWIDSPYFGNPRNLNLQFRLEDQGDEQWEYISQGQPITFSQLSPGSHTIVVRKMNSFYSHYTHKRITLIVPPYFWETDWFLLLLLLAVPVLLYYSIKFRIRYVRYKNMLLQKKIAENTRHLRNAIRTLKITRNKLEQQTSIQEKLIASISHDIRSPLRFMVDTAKYIHNHYDMGDRETIHKGIYSLYTASENIYDFISKLLEYSKAKAYDQRKDAPPDIYDLHEMVAEKISLFSEIGQSQKTGIYNGVPKAFLTTVSKHLLSIIIHNLIDNAVKNTYGGTISIQAFLKKQRLYITVRDTGRGMSAGQLQHYRALFHPEKIKAPSYEHHEKNLGMKIILDLLIILNGEIDIRSTLQKGTVITLNFPQKHPLPAS